MRFFLSVVLSLALALPLFAEESPAVNETIFRNNYDIHIIEDHEGITSIFYDGFIMDESHKILLYYLNENPDIKRVYLNSDGGNVFSSLKMGDMIRNKGIDTYIGKGMLCASACAYTFVAGNNFVINGTLAFHNPYYVTPVPPDQFATVINLTFYMGASLSHWFAESGFKSELFLIIASTTGRDRFLIYNEFNSHILKSLKVENNDFADYIILSSTPSEYRTFMDIKIANLGYDTHIEYKELLFSSEGN